MTRTIRDVDPESEDAAALRRALDADLQARYPGGVIDGIDADRFRSGGGVFLVACEDGQPVTCGALRPLRAGGFEVKRMFVAAAARGRGHGRAL